MVVPVGGMWSRPEATIFYFNLWILYSVWDIFFFRLTTGIIYKKGLSGMTDKKSLDFSNVDEVFDYAIGKEKEAHDFYMEWAGRLEKPAMREVFEELAAQEEGHMRLFTSMKKGHVESRPEVKAVDLHLTDYIVEAAPSKDMGYREAIRVAIQREQAAIELYTEFGKATSSQEISKTLDTLVAEETKHKNRLEKIYDDEFYPEN